MKSPIFSDFPVSVEANLEVFLIQEGLPQKRIIRIIDFMKTEKGLNSMKGHWDKPLTTMHPVCWAILCEGALALNEAFKEEILKNN